MCITILIQNISLKKKIFKAFKDIYWLLFL
jgi:hypothetical protein